ncbi:hypothetical protein SAMN06269185_3057 [Natronoarchaeum philippinense]|uniref:Uncharacterized protein n=1 Tax=Natronoarchaeum philippinense TaxID=558529 RepID=A0A285P799_NATPI|nr:hypothetical protein [Natronoarchaeum philippinense]SNZ17610.1 hypothetical protein SAMN06269185_3057 [Natronoarchaeum philippinense]
MSESAPRRFDAVDRLRSAHERLERLRSEVAEAGESDLEAVAEAHRSAHRLLERYVDDATGTGDFESYVEFRGEFATLVEDLPEDLPRREAFEDALDAVDKRRLSESDFADARAALARADDLVDLLENRDDARESYRQARIDATDRLDTIDERIDELDRLLELGEADLDAPVERLREPIEAYDEAVREAFREYRQSASAREVLSFVDRTRAFPLVDLPRPPEELLDFVRESPDGTEPIPTLLEYAGYSRSKLEHYADDADALKRAVATERTYLDRLDADSLTVGWPPPERGVLRWRAVELRKVVDRFADEDVIELLRAVRAATAEQEYERLRDAAVATHRLDADDRERLASGAVADERDDLRAERVAIETALDDLPEP